MKKFTLVLCTFLLPLSLNAAQITVKIKNIKKNSGNIKVGLFSEKKQKDFPNGKAFIEKNVPANASEISVVFDSIASGVYAIGAYNDENKNSKLDKALGIPTEAYGNSGKFTKLEPKFSSSQFEVTDENKSIEFVLH